MVQKSALYAGLVLLAMLVSGIAIQEFCGKPGSSSRSFSHSNRPSPSGSRSRSATSREKERREAAMSVPQWRVLLMNGEYSKSYALLQKGLLEARKAGEVKKEQRFLYDLGTYSGLQGFFIEGIVYLEKSMEVAQKNNWPLKAAMSGLKLGKYLIQLSRHDEALDTFEECLKVFTEYNLDGLRAVCLVNMGHAAWGQLEYDLAVEYGNDALEIFKKQDDPENLALFYWKLATVHRRFGRYKKALKILKEGLAVANNPEHNAFYNILLMEIGYTYQMKKDYKNAGKCLKLVTDAYKVPIGKGLVHKSTIAQLKFFNAEYLLETGKFSDALALLNGYDPGVYESMSDFHNLFRQKAEALRGLGKEKEASEELVKAVSLIEEKRWERGRDTSMFYDSRLGGGNILPYRLLIAALAERSLKGDSRDENFVQYGNDTAAGGFYFSECLKARVLLDLLATRPKYDDDAGSILPPELKKKEQELLKEFKREAWMLRAVSARGTGIVVRVKKRKDLAFKKLQTFIRELQRSHPLYAFTHYPNPVQAESLPLQKSEALIEYAFLNEALYIFLVKKGEPVKVFKVAEKRETIKKWVSDLCRPFKRDPVSGELPYNLFSAKQAKTLYDKLLGNVLKHVKKGNSLVIIPDGILALLPFEILVVEAGGNLSETVFAADRWDISYYQSASIMTVNRNMKGKRPTPPKLLLALGNPVYNDTDPRYNAYQEGRKYISFQDDLRAHGEKYKFTAEATRRQWGSSAVSTGSAQVPEQQKASTTLTFAPLPESETEILNIARVLGINSRGPDVLLNMDASETRFRQATLSEYRYLHFATHADLPGKVLGITEPFILLGQVNNKEPDDGFLTLSEVSDLKLEADMVVLSACVTGLGDVREVEGVANFAYAFHSAGAKSVVVSLWEVASRQAVEFMTLFYRQLKKGENRARALTFARKEIRKRFPNPFFWAPFILHGEKE